jgi:hypothetical protein
MALASSEQHCGVVPRTALRTGSLCTARLLAAGLQAALWPFFWAPESGEEIRQLKCAGTH